MAKQLNVNLAFSADTSKAKAQIQELTQALQNVSKMPASASSLFDDVSIKKASQAAMELEQHLSKAVNVDTGKLDLSRFSSSLKASGKNLSDYSQTLLSIGTTGQQAFLSLARAIASADTPVTRVNKKVAELGITLKNTARWQLSSSVLHGFMGAIQSAYGYAQDLNESLNDIRIVTGQSVDQMKDFAVEANRAAKSLSATTTEYTKASLIFYQQGLSDSEVQERSDITIKMSQAAGESADQVSSYMTAIWNNFDDGSKSLEYYGDVMANLGAKTAASSAEIAEGLEKFAAIGDTVGLSYEYATAAVTTIVDKTRASASTVGDALKTIFARLQGLKLGETLEDGVDLNKYSAALQAVGIEILDLNGNLKSADNIIQELGETWETLSNAQQTALAQTVAGTRQYTQLMALMNNFSAFEQNVDYAKTSEGTLQEQANIYAESWEAAQNRVRAAAENIYDSLINDEFFIDLLNGFEKVLETVGGLIDGLGGLKGIVGIVGSVFLTTFAQKMPETLSNLKQNFMVFTGQAQKEMQKVQAELNKELAVQQSIPGASQEYIAELEGLKQVSAMKQKLVQASKNLTTQERAEYEAKIKNVEMMQEEIIALTKKKKALEEAERAAQKSLSTSGSKGISNLTKDFTTQVAEIERLQANEKRLKEQANEVKKRSKVNKKTGQVKQTPEDNARIVAIEAERQANSSAMAEAESKAKALETQITAVGKAYGLTAEQINDMVLANGKLSPEAMEVIKKEAGAVGEEFSKLVRQRTNLENLGTSVKGQAKDWKTAGAAIKDYVVKTNNIKGAKKDVDDMKKHMSAYLKKIQELAKTNGLSISKKQVQELRAAIDGMNVDNIEDVADSFASFSENLGKGTDGKINKLDGQIEQLRDKMTDMQFGDEAISNMEHTAEAAANVGVELDNIRENVRGFATEAPEGIFHASTAITEFGSAAMSASTLISSIQSAISVFSDEGATGFEKVGAAISIVTAAMATFNSIQALSTTLTKSDAAAKLFAVLGYKMIKTESGALTLAKITETGAVVANTAAWYANPVMWIAVIIMAVIAAIVALVSALGAQAKAQKAANEATLKYANEAQEAIDSTQELSESVKDLTDSYEELSKAGENTTNILTQMDEKIPELITSYRELIKTLAGTDSSKLEALVDELEQAYNLAKLTGDYSGFIEKQEEIDQTIAQAEYNNAVTGGRAGAQLAATAMNDATGGKMTNTKMTLDVGGVDSGAGEEIKAQQILSDTMGSYYTNSNGLFKYGAELTADYSDPAAFVDYYEKLQKAQSEMLSTMTDDQLAKSDIYREISEALSSGAEYYEQMVPLAQAQIEAGGQLAEAAVEEEIGLAMEDVDTMEEYLAYKKEYIEQAKKLGLSEDQAQAYLDNAEALSRMTDEYALAENMLKNFSGLSDKQIANMDPEELKAYTDELAKNLSAAFGDLSDEQMSIAVSIAATSESIEEFSQRMQQAMIESARVGYVQSAETAATAMQEAVENGKFNLGALLSDDNFLDYLEEIGMSATALTAASYEEQYRIVSEFHSKLNTMAFDSYTAQQELYYQQMADTQNELANFYEATSGSSAQAVKDAQAAYADLQTQLSNTTDENEITRLNNEMDDLAEKFEQEYGFEITSNAETLQNELDDILNKINEIQDKKIEMAMDWSGVDEVENGLKKAASFTQLIRNEAKKTGDSYQLTASQAREWLEFYPELGAIAETTTDGLISLNAAEVDAFISGKEEELNTSIDTKIDELEAQKAALQTELDLKQKDLEAAQALAEGKLELENVSAQYLTELRSNLTQYFMDLGMDEVTANAAALETMGLNEEEYSQLVADACETNATNMTYAAEDGANAQVATLGQLVQRWQSFGSYLINNIGPLLLDIGAAILDPTRSVGDVMMSAWNASAISVGTSGSNRYTTNTGNYTFDAGDQSQITAAYKDVATPQLESVNAAMTELQNAINSIDGQIDYLNALKNQGLENYDDDDPNDDDDNNSTKKDKDKDVEEMIDNAERYHEITKEIEAMERAYDRLADKKDRAFGRDKLAAMEEEIALGEQLLEKEQDLLEAQTVFLASDLAALKEGFTTNVQLDEYGNLANYSDLLEEAQTAYNNAKTAYNNSAQEDADKDLLEAAEKEYEEKMALLEQYEETLEAQQEQADKVREQAQELQDLNYDKINYKLEFKLDINDKDLERIDYYLNKISNDAHGVAEAYGYLQSQTALYTDNLKAQESYMAEIEENYRLGKISQEAYYEALAESQSATIENLQSLEETKKSMREYYGNVMDAAMEKVSMYTDQMEHLNSVLDHYSNILSLAGKDSDTEMKGKVLDSKANNLRNEMLTQKALYENSATEAAKWKAKMDSAVEGSNEWETYKANWEKAQEVANEAQDAMLSKTEEWAEATKAIVENELAGLAQDLEKSLTGGTSFDEMITSMDRASSLQEDYLTTTNQIYETNKLMRQAQQEIDKSSNSAAKKRLQNFINETAEMQNQNKLSQHELNIQQAKYDLLLAEMALEEAKDAKSTVRLQRDSEGNFGYVYTADTSAVSAAEQELADKQNALYNLGLEGANEYNQKYAQTLQESQEAITELTAMWMNGEISSEEEFQRRRDELQRYYTEKLEGYSHQYQVSLTTDSRVIKDAWSSDFSDMMYKTEEWGAAVNSYFGDASGSLAKWTEAQATLLSETGLNNVDSAVAAINEESEKLATTLIGEDGDGGVVGAMKEEVEAVGELSEAYISVQNEIDKTIKKYEQFLNTVNQNYTGPESIITGPNATTTTTPTATGSTTPNTQNTSTTTNTSPTTTVTTNTSPVTVNASTIAASGNQDNLINTAQISATKLEQQQAEEIKKLKAELEKIKSDYEEVYFSENIKLDGDGHNSKDSIVTNDKAKALEFYEVSYSAMIRQQEMEYSLLLEEKSRMIKELTGGPHKKMMLQEQEALEAMFKEQIAMSGKMIGAGGKDISTDFGELKNILDVIDFESSKAQLGNLLIVPSMRDNAIEKLEQEVYIEAHFPDVQDRLEIEEAFNNLINKASQYANRK